MAITKSIIINIYFVWPYKKDKGWNLGMKSDNKFNLYKTHIIFAFLVSFGLILRFLPSVSLYGGLPLIRAFTRGVGTRH